MNIFTRIKLALIYFKSLKTMDNNTLALQIENCFNTQILEGISSISIKKTISNIDLPEIAFIISIGNNNEFKFIINYSKLSDIQYNIECNIICDFYKYISLLTLFQNRFDWKYRTT